MKKKHWFVRILSFLAIFSFFLNCTCSASTGQGEHKVSLEEVLDSFGFSSEKQQDAFKFICKKAGVPLPDEFGAQELLYLVLSTQNLLVNRADKQERWETTNLNWMEQNVKLLNEKFKDLGFVNAVLPNEMHYDAVCILGARRSEMEKRIKFVESLVKNGYRFEKVILLTGERYATVGVDGTAEEIEELACFLGIDSSKVTEANIFRYIYEKSSLKCNFELVVIDTPQKDGRRPTTQTTVEDFCRWNKDNPEVKTAMIVSSQPYVDYQMAIVNEVLRQNNSDLSFLAVGDRYVPSDSSVKTLSGALGSYIWTWVPNCLRHFGFEFKSDGELSLVKRLYGHMPWLYNNLPFAPGLLS